MMNHARLLPTLFLLVFITSACSKPVPSPSAGEIVRLEDFESEFVAARNIDVWLPPGYDVSGEGYPVIYAQDGQNLFSSETAAFGGTEWEFDETIVRLGNEGRIRPAIVVGIWNTMKRFLEYQPQIPFERQPEDVQNELIDEYGGSPISDDYLRFMVSELKPHIDQNYNTLPDRANTFVLGSSMGGLISAYAVAKYPDVFGGAACLSTHWPVTLKVNRSDTADRIIDYLASELPGAGDHVMYFDYGTETLDAWYEPHQQKMDAAMAALGYQQGEDWVTLKFEGDPHNETAWKERLHIPIELLLKK